MKIKLLTVFMGLLLLAMAPASNAQIAISLGFNSCGYQGYYQTCPGYGPPVGVYLGGGGWGGGGRDYHDHDRNHDRNHDRDHGHGHDRGDDHGGDRGNDHGHDGGHHR